jgi:hypothetical protein
MGINCHPYLGLYTIPQYSIFGVGVKDSSRLRQGDSQSSRSLPDLSLRGFLAEAISDDEQSDSRSKDCFAEGGSQ